MEIDIAGKMDAFVENSETLFHYCTAASFVSIISNRKIRLSSLKSSNDATEGALVSEAMKRACQADALASDFAQYIVREAEGMEEMNSGKGFCLSTKADLLSQWRAYGGDGTGLCIGFSRSYLNKLIERYVIDDPSLALIPVVYNQIEHDSIVLPIYKEIKPILEDNAQWVKFISGALSRVDRADFQQFCSNVFAAFRKSSSHLYQLKHSTFSEESEWRIVTLAKVICGNREEYAESNGVISEFISLPLDDLGENIVTKVILGPKHKNSPAIINELLWNNEFGSVEILDSGIPYK